MSQHLTKSHVYDHAPLLHASVNVNGFLHLHGSAYEFDDIPSGVLEVKSEREDLGRRFTSSKYTYYGLAYRHAYNLKDR